MLPDFLYRFLYRLGGVVCHQLPERSLYAGGRPLPMCARCTGLYLGLLVVAAGWYGIHRAARRAVVCRSPGSWRDLLICGALAALSLVPLEIDGLGNMLGLWRSNAFIRIMTGGAMGFGLPVFFVAVMGYEGKEARFTMPAGGVWVLPALLALSLLAAVGAYTGYLALNGWLGLFIIAGLVTAFAAAVYLLWVKVVKVFNKNT